MAFASKAVCSFFPNRTSQEVLIVSPEDGF